MKKTLILKKWTFEKIGHTYKIMIIVITMIMIIIMITMTIMITNDDAKNHKQII